MRNYDRESIFDESQEPSMNQKESDSSKNKKKKIKKHKKESRLAADLNRQQIPIISQLVQDATAYFDSCREELVERYRQLVSKADIVSMIKQQKPIFDIKQNDCQSETARYLELLNLSQQYHCQQIALSNQLPKAIALSMLRPFADCEEQRVAFRNIRFMNANETYLYRVREETRMWLAEKIEQIAKSIGYKDSQIEYIEPHMEMLALFKINKDIELETQRLVNTYISREDELFNSHVLNREFTSQLLHNSYLRAMIIKNFEKGFTEQPIDFYNYHKGVEVYQENNFSHARFQRIKSLNQFQKYIEVRKPRGKSKDIQRRGKERKHQKNYLRTPCSACFSDYSQMSNPIQKCPQCQNRAHKSCQNVNRCHRCRYCRTSKKQRDQTGFCYICDRSSQKGLMILTVTNSSPHYYAHSFCLLAHNLWRVQDGDFKGRFIKTNQNAHPCPICNNQSKKGIMVDCQSCGTKVHAMCAYLAGFSFTMRRTQSAQQISYGILIDCCTGQDLKERLSFERKFKLNYEKVVFRRERKFKLSEELYDYIERNTPEA